MFNDWNFKALGLKNASSGENMMLIAFVNYFFANIWKIMHKYYCFWEKNKVSLYEITLNRVAQTIKPPQRAL